MNLPNIQTKHPVIFSELPVPKPQAVIDHETRMRRVMDEQNASDQLPRQ